MVLDFLIDWTVPTIILAAFALMVGVLAGSYVMAFAWRRWKEGKRRKGAPRAAGAAPQAPTGTGFARITALRKLPKPGLKGLRRK